MSTPSPSWLVRPRIVARGLHQLVTSAIAVGRVIVEETGNHRDVDLGEGAPTQTVDFSYRGNSYRIELPARAAEEFDEAMAPYLGAAQRVTGTRTGTGTPKSPPTKPVARQTSDAKQVRAWAKKLGLIVSDRGRISADVMRRYHDAHGV